MLFNSDNIVCCIKKISIYPELKVASTTLNIPWKLGNLYKNLTGAEVDSMNGDVNNLEFVNM